MALESLPWGDFAIDALGSLSTFQHDVFSQNTEELKQGLLRTTLELEALKSSYSEEMRKKEENINKLIQLVKVTTKERDEAKDQLSTLLSYLQPKSPQLNQGTGVNSGLTESDSLSETQTRNNHQSYVSSSSPVESFFDADSSNINNRNTMINVNNNYDHASAVIDHLSKRRPLPEKGKLMQAVMEAGPLLQTLMVAGPLPRWRNPPPLNAFQVPPLSVKARSNVGLSPNQVSVGPQLSYTNGSGLCNKRQMVLPLDHCFENLSGKRQRIL